MELCSVIAECTRPTSRASWRDEEQVRVIICFHLFAVRGGVEVGFAVIREDCYWLVDFDEVVLKLLSRSRWEGTGCAIVVVLLVESVRSS